MMPAVLSHVASLDREQWVIVACVCLIVAAVVWLGSECSWLKANVRSLGLRVKEVEASQKRLKVIVEKGWSNSLDLTKIDWRRPDPARK